MPRLSPFCTSVELLVAVALVLPRLKNGAPLASFLCCTILILPVLSFDWTWILADPPAEVDPLGIVKTFRIC